MSEANYKLIRDIPRITHINLHNEYLKNLGVVGIQLYYRRRNMRDLLLLLLVMRRRQRRQNRRQRRVWVHETLQTRDDRGEFHTLVHELHSYDDRFFEYFRMSQAQFAHILSILKPSITKQTTKFRQPIGCPEKLANSPTFCFVLDTRHYRQAPSSAVA